MQTREATGSGHPRNNTGGPEVKQVVGLVEQHARVAVSEINDFFPSRLIHSTSRAEMTSRIGAARELPLPLPLPLSRGLEERGVGAFIPSGPGMILKSGQWGQ